MEVIVEVPIMSGEEVEAETSWMVVDAEVNY